MMSLLLAAASRQYGTGNHIWGWMEFFDMMSCWQLQVDNTGQAINATVRIWLRGWECAHLRDTIRNATERMSTRDPLLSDYQSSLDELLTCLHQLSAQWERYLDHLKLEGSVTAYAVPVDRSHRRLGRPQLEISRDQLEYLVSLSFNWTQIAGILGTSSMTVYRRRQEFGMLDEPRTLVMENC